MNDYYCSICDETINLGYEEKHINSKAHEELSESVINNYCVKSPELDKIENIIKHYANNHDKTFGFYNVKCKFDLQFGNGHFLLNGGTYILVKEIGK